MRNGAKEKQACVREKLVSANKTSGVATAARQQAHKINASEKAPSNDSIDDQTEILISDAGCNTTLR